MSEKNGLPLEGIRVVEFTHMVMGPTCGMVLADLGAEVIKVEPPGGDKTRSLPGLGIGFFRSFNRNKKSVVIDIATPEGQETARDLMGQCDVVLENFRPGLMAKFGLDYDTVSKDHPHLIYASHKGFLPGPYENRLALDEVVQNMAGLTYMTGPAGRPLRAGSSVNDIMGGMFGAIGILAALQERNRTGKGQEIQSALFENCALLASQHMQQFMMTGEKPDPLPERGGTFSVYNIFTLAGDEQLFIAATSDKHFRALCQVIGRMDLANDPELATNTQRFARQPYLLSELRKTLAGMESESLQPLLQDAGLPYAPIVRPDQLCQDKHLIESGGLVPMTTEDGGTTQAVLLPLLMNGRRPGVRRPLPRVGEHNEEILGKLPVRATA